MEPKLFSVAVLTYRNTRYLDDILTSVFEQDYPNIELIVSNDCSEDFNVDDVTYYCNKYKTKNIKNVIINKNKENMGTVKHLNKLLDLINGEYIMFIAGDDTIYNKKVLSSFAKKFEELGDDALLVTSQCAMYDEKLENLLEYALSDEKIRDIKEMTPQRMFRRLTQEYTIPAGGTCYRRRLYDICGKYDEKYFLIEDLYFFTKLSRMGIRTYFLDDVISIKHRDGGVSHGNNNNPSSAFMKYIKDEILWHENEVFKYKRLLTKEEYKNSMKRYTYLLTIYKMKSDNTSKFEKIKFMLKPAIFKNLLFKIMHKVNEYILPKVYDKKLFKSIGIAIIALLLFNYIYPYQKMSSITNINYVNIYIFINNIILICGSYFMFAALYRLVYKMFLIIKFLSNKLN